MASDVRDAYIRATFTLSKSDPQAWANFIEAFKAYTTEEMEKGLSGGDPLISVGMGRRMKMLRDDFIGIQGLMDKIKK